MEKTLATLIAARGYIARGFVQHLLGKSRDGRAVSGTDPSAVAWCTVGALERATGHTHAWWYELDSHPAGQAVSELYMDLPPDWVSHVCSKHQAVVMYNNSHTQEEVLALFDKTIARLEGKNKNFFKTPDEVVIAPVEVREEVYA